jgi:Holliday junction resolvasome RuvABC endonuclease subunit
VSFYLGIDQALRKIGIAVLRDDEVILLKRIVPPQDVSGGQRLVALRDALQITLEPFKEIAGVAMEGQSYNSDGQIDQLGQIAGVVQTFIIDRFGMEPMVVPPAVLKKFVTGNGNATKTQMMRKTYDFWKVPIDDDDICDAHGMARIARQLHCKTTTIRHQIESLKSLTTKKRRKRRVKKLLPKTL